MAPATSAWRTRTASSAMEIDNEQTADSAEPAAVDRGPEAVPAFARARPDGEGAGAEPPEVRGHGEPPPGTVEDAAAGVHRVRVREALPQDATGPGAFDRGVGPGAR